MGVTAANRSDEGITLEKSALKLFKVAIYIINSFDNPKLPRYTLPPTQHHSFLRLPLFVREGMFFTGGGGRGGSGYFRNFCEKSRGPPTYQNGLMHDPSQITTQKHLTLPPPPPRQNNRR